MGKFIEEKLIFQSTDRREIAVYKWSREKQKINGLVQIAHGMAETASRYRSFAQQLTKAGFIVYANDHRGHGESADSINHQGYLGAKFGFKLLIADMARLSQQIKQAYPKHPLFLFSHSMGSFAAQRYIMDYHPIISGLILAGSNGPQGYQATAGKILAKIEMMLRGKKAKSYLMNHLVFEAYNKHFDRQHTGFEWLTRDQEELVKYLDNPYCGQVFPASFYYEFLKTIEYIENPNNFYKIPPDLPLLIISGQDDPVGDFGSGVKKLKKRYEKSDVKDLEMLLYEGARHELLHEINRQEIIYDTIKWLERKNEESRSLDAETINGK